MPNELPGKPSLLDYAVKAGPACGGICGLAYAGAYVCYFLKDHDLSSLAQVFFGIGFASASYGIGRAVTKASDINVSAQAENRINNPNLPNSSVVPQIQAEIDKQKAESFRTKS